MAEEKSKFLRYLLIIEVNVVLILLGFLFFKVNSIEQKVFRTNKFVYDLLTDKRIEELSKAEIGDIVIGNANAPVTIVMYTKFGCPYCNEFFGTTFLDLKTNYFDRGLVKFVVRFLVTPNSAGSFFAAQSSYYAHSKNLFLDFNQKIMLTENMYNDTTAIKTTLFEMVREHPDFDAFMHSMVNDNLIIKKVANANQGGISKTPTFIIHGKVLIGNRRMAKFEELILEELNALSCD
jgi:protein-disulfide isomerase